MKNSIIALICLSVILTNCSKSESNNEPLPVNMESEQNCLIEEIRFATSKFEYIYNTNDELQQIINTYNDIPTTYYVNKITNDSIIIKRNLSDINYDFPAISVKYNGDKIIELKRYYNAETANIFSFEYSEEKITVRRDYTNGNSFQNITYADYFLNQNGNISSRKLYVFDINSPNNYTFYNELTYTYDSQNNPWKGIIYPTFLCQNLPNSMFFSQNNALTETNINTTSTDIYSYEYDENNLTIKGLDKHPYNVCNGSNTLDEYYSYTNCYNY